MNLSNFFIFLFFTDKVKRPSTDIRRDDLDIPQAKMREVIPSGG